MAGWGGGGGVGVGGQGQGGAGEEQQSGQPYLIKEVCRGFVGVGRGLQGCKLCWNA